MVKKNRVIRLATVAAAVCATACGAVDYAASANASASAISGIVKGSQGQAVGGAQVQLNAFAVNKTGVHEISVESTTSDASGRYSLPAPAASQTAALTTIDAGTINYEVDVTSVSNGVLQSATTTAPANAVFSNSPQARTAAGLAVSGGINLTMHPVHLAGGALAHAKSSAISPHRDCTNNYATWNSVSGGTYNVIIGEPHAYIDMSVQYSYQESAVTTLGLAYSTDGGNSWGASGTSSISYVGGSGMKTSPSGIHYAPYIYGLFTNVKQQETFNCTGPSNNYRIVGTGWTGGATISGNLTQYDGGSSPIWQYDMSVHSGNIHIPLGVTWTKSGGSGHSYSAGANFGGVNLTADTTYSSSVVYTWVMFKNANVGHDLFGANGVYPAQGSGADVVYAN